MKSKHIGKEKESSEFSRMLEQSFEGISQMEPGSSHHVRVINIKEQNYVLVALENGQGLIDREEFLDKDNNITVSTGEKIEVYYIKSENGEMKFTTKPVGDVKYQIAVNAMENRKPFQADSIQKIKGGYEVVIGELQAFCPISHMVEEPDLAEDALFLITEVSNKRVIVSRKAYKELKRDHQKELLQGELSVGDIVSGKVVSLQNFGAFVDLGGIEALIPVSEIAFHRVNHPSDELSSGEEIRAKVLSVDWSEDRITLSRKAILENPWQGKMPFDVGAVLEGTVESIKNFGIFVGLSQNFTGLVPMSESGIPRGQSPAAKYNSGQKVRVMVVSIDREKERISLSIRKVADADTRKEYEDYIDKQNEDTKSDENVSSFGKQLMKAMKKQK